MPFPGSFRPVVRRIAPALLLTLAAGCAHRGAPAAFPAFEAAAAQPSLVAVKLLATDYLPPFPQCESKDVICMDPPPTWVKFRTLQPVYGGPSARTFYASTTSHYGKMDAYGFAEKPMLVLLLTHDDDTVLPRYSRANLETDSTGELHLVLNDAGPHWLPCSIAALREPITDSALVRASALPRTHYDDYFAGDRAEFFRLDGELAHPRYSVPLSRLRTHLAGRNLSAQDFRCERSNR